MADPISQSIATIKGVLKLYMTFHKTIEAIKDTDRKIEHLRTTCKVVGLHLGQIKCLLERRHGRPDAFPNQDPYYPAIQEVVELLELDLIHIRDNALPTKLHDSSGVMGKFFKSKVVKAWNLKRGLNDEALQRIQWNINLLILTGSQLWDYERLDPSVFDRDIQDNLRVFLRRLDARQAVFRTQVAGFLPAPETVETLRTSAFSSANRVVMRSYGAGYEYPVDAGVISPIELKEQQEAVERMVDTALRQDFPDAAAGLQSKAMKIGERLKKLGNEPQDFLANFQQEARYVSILISCINPANVAKGRDILKTLAEKAIELSETENYVRAVYSKVSEQVGQLYCKLSEWETGIVHLRNALNGGNLIEYGKEDDIRRIAHQICLAYEALEMPFMIEAFKNSSLEVLKVDLTADPKGLEAAITWCRERGWNVDDNGSTPSFLGLKDADGEYPLHKAVRDPDVPDRVLERLCMDREALHARGLHNLTPLQLAVENKQINAVKILLAEGASMHILKPPEDMAETVLHSCGDPEILDLLLKKLHERRPSDVSSHQDLSELPSSLSPPPLPLHINSTNLIGDTPLHSACIESVRCVKILLKHGADPNAHNNHLQTPLILASYRKQSRSDTRTIVKLLMRYGADPALSDGRGRRAIDGLNETFGRDEAKRLLTVSLDGEALSSRTVTGTTYVSSSSD